MTRYRSTFFIVFALLLVSLLILTACDTPKQTSPGTISEPESASEPEASLNSGFELVDAAGQTLKFDQIPQRIVVVGRAPHMVLHLLYMFPETENRLVGLEKKGGTISEFLPLIDPSLDNKVILETNPNAEQIASLEPDVVIMKNTMVDEVGETLAQIGIPAVYVNLETPELFLQDLANLGLILGNEKRAQEIGDFYQIRLNCFAEAIKNIEENEKPRVLLVEYSDRGSTVAVQVPAESWMQTIQVQMAGGHPVWLEEAQPTDGYTVVNLEQIARWDPDQIYLVVWFTLDPQEVVDTLKADPRWNKLKALKNEQCYAFPTDIFGWDIPEPRWILGMTWLAKNIHPDLFQDIDMENEIYDFFGQMYGMDTKAIEEQIMPEVQLDVH